MELFPDVPQKSIKAVTVQIMAALIDVATALGLNSQTCTIHLRDQTPDISAVFLLIDRLVRDYKEVVSLTEKLQGLMMLEVDEHGCKFCSATGSTPRPSPFFDGHFHDIGEVSCDTN
jgi:hypothetical protein